MAFSHLFRTGSLGGLAMRNRIVMPPMATNFASATGEPTDRLIAYYRTRARGGAGLILVENATIEHRQGGNGAVQLRIDEDRYIPGLHRLAEEIRRGGAAAAVQINHAGAVARTAQRPVSPSAIDWNGSDADLHMLDGAEIEALVSAFAGAALRAKRAGFDGIELHGAHGYLIAQFLSPRMNRRTDAYGGTAERRWRFALDVVRATRDAVGESYPVLFRVSGDEYLPDGRAIGETCDLAQALVEAGVDALHVTAATPVNPEHQLEPMAAPEAWRIGLAEAIKQAVEVPVIGVGVIRSPATAERVLSDGQADYVAIGRGLIADPDWPRKAMGEDPRPIRRCISCNRCVRHRVFDDLPIRCSVNPRVGRESEPERAGTKGRKVVVVGAGPAGLTAASEGAARGHRVTLFEAEAALGGRLRAATLPPHKEKVGWLIEDLCAALPDAVEVRTGERVEASDVLALRPDAAVLAIGGTPTGLRVPGADLPHVVVADDVLAAGIGEAKWVVVIGGGMVGCETAAFCASRGAAVTILEVCSELAADCEPIARAVLMRQLEEQGVSIRCDVRVKAISANEVAISSDEGPQSLPAALVVCAVGYEPNRTLSEALAEAPFPVYAIGDAREPRSICEAVDEGWRVAVAVGELEG